MLLVDYHVHGMGHGTSSHTPEELAAYLEQAGRAGLAEVGIAEHDWYLKKINWEALREVAEKYPALKLRVGLEVDFRPGRRLPIGRKLVPYPFDYLIGSVHEIGGWMFDHPDHIEGYKRWEPDKLYSRYFKLVARVAEWGLFDIIGHLDLIKIFRLRPQGDVLKLARPALLAIAKAGAAVEVNTAGLYKPVGEIYPSQTLLEECFRLNIPVTMGSDAHQAKEVGRELPQAADLIKKAGYQRVCGFQQRQRYFMELD